MPIPGELDDGAPHVIFVPSAGMAHLVPFFRFITALSGHGVDCSVVTVLPTVSAAEANHLAGLFTAFPRIHRVDFNLLPFDASAFPGADPFLLRWEALRRSAHFLGPLIAGTTPRVSAVVTGVTIASHVVPIAKELRVPCHVLFISSAAMLSLVAYFPIHLNSKARELDVDIPGVRYVPRSCLPQPLLNLNNLFTKQFIDNGREIIKADGILVNTFDTLEPVALAALRDGKVILGFPPVYTVGLLKSNSPAAIEKAETANSPVAWLEGQPACTCVRQPHRREP
uniref:Uncharacterized protein n=1 Tax=Arundo donax TaxID=35708 RepID=A0A0A9FSV0_ARUDO